MNSDTLKGEGRDVGGKLKETTGSLTGNRSLEGEGLVDQLGGKLQKVLGTARDGTGSGGANLLDQAKEFARKRPFAASALAGVIGMALLGTLRGR